MKKKEIKYINWSMAGLILLLNLLFFIKQTIQILSAHEGTMGDEFQILLVTLSVNLLMIIAILTFKKKFTHSSGFMLVNSLGLLWIGFWYIILSNG